MQGRPLAGGEVEQMQTTLTELAVKSGHGIA
jgi:hypothetical protein